MTKYNLLKSTRNTTFWPKVGKMGVGKQVLTQCKVGTCLCTIYYFGSLWVTLYQDFKISVWGIIALLGTFSYL